MAVAAVGHGARDGEGGVGGLGPGGGPALVWPALDASSPLLAGAVLAGVYEAVLDTAATGDGPRRTSCTPSGS